MFTKGIFAQVLYVSRPTRITAEETEIQKALLNQRYISQVIEDHFFKEHTKGDFSILFFCATSFMFLYF